MNFPFEIKVNAAFIREPRCDCGSRKYEKGVVCEALFNTNRCNVSPPDLAEVVFQEETDRS